MGRIIVSNLMSLDGFLEAPGADISWFNPDEEFFEYAREMLNAAEGLLFGRKTYQLMKAYWPDTTDDDPVITHKMNHLPKVVFSKTLSSVDWKNARLAEKPLTAEIKVLKKKPGKDWVLLGSGDILSALLQEGLIDEYRFIVHPIVLGAGRYMFRDIKDRIRLRFIKSRQLASGNVISYYEPAR